MSRLSRLHLYLPPFRPRIPRDEPSAEESEDGELEDLLSDYSSGASDNGSDGNRRDTVKVNSYYYRHRAAQEQERLQKMNRKIWFQEEVANFFGSSLPIWRRNSQEYIALVVSFVFLIVESLVRIITLALPAPVLRFFYEKSRILFNKFAPKSHTTTDSTRREKNIVARVREADGFVELCAIWGYEAEEHIVQTTDGYLLGLHRVRKKGFTVNRGRERSKGRRGTRGWVEENTKGVVYMHHGLLMNSEVWVCLLESERCLPFVLVDLGYDVWLGNNRGNKYSKKSINHQSSAPKFWDFSIDEFAMHDIPDSINYILNTTKSKSLSYIGFSQGTAQAFASLSIHPALNEMVDVFIALAPAMSPAGLHNPIVDAFVKASPNFLYFLFGRKSILSSTTLWQSLLYPPLFVRIIDSTLAFLFNWRAYNITLNQKIAAYAHLYSFTSTKSVVHWFQIMRNKTFQMYDDDLQPFLSFTRRNFYKVARFPTRNITTPIVLVYGGSDSLVDIGVMLKELPGHTVAKGIDHYEHLDMLWGHDVHELVFPTVLEALETYSSSRNDEMERGSNIVLSGGTGVQDIDGSYPIISNRKTHQKQGLVTTEAPRPFSEDKMIGITTTNKETDSALTNALNEFRFPRESKNIDVPSHMVRKRSSSFPLKPNIARNSNDQEQLNRPSLETTESTSDTSETSSTTSINPSRPIPRSCHTAPVGERLSSSAPAGLTSASSSFGDRNPFSIFNPSLFTKRISRRSDSICSDISIRSVGSVRSVGSSVTAGSESGAKVIGSAGIIVGKAGASTADSKGMEQIVAGLTSKERKRQKEGARERR